MRINGLNNGGTRPICSEMVTGQPAAHRRSLHAARPQRTRSERVRAVASGRVQASAGERGAAIVEFALVSIFLFILIFGLIEGGLAVRARNAVTSSADEAARRGAIAGNSQSADWQILRQLEVRGTLAAARVKYVVVYRADASDQPPIDACAGTPAGDDPALEPEVPPMPVTGECNVYEIEDFAAPSSAFNCGDPELDGSWCPTDRAQDSEGFEYIGVLVIAEHTALTGVFPGGIDLEGRSVLPLEGSGGI